METTNLRNINRQELHIAFEEWVKAEKAKGLVDVKFCVGSGTTDDAMRQVLHIHEMEEKGQTRLYSDY